MDTVLNKKKKIVFFVSKTIPFNAGTGRNAYNFALYLSKYNNVRLVSVNDNLVHPFKSKVNKLKIYRLPYFNKSKIQKIISFPILFFHYMCFIPPSKIIIIYGSIVGFELIIPIVKLLNKKVVFQSTLQGEDDIETLLAQSVFPKSLMKNAIKKIDVYYSINRDFIPKPHFLPEKWENKILLAPQGVNTDCFHPINDKKKNELRQKHCISHKTLIIISIGYLIKRKGYDGLFEQLSKLDIDYKYIIVGDYKVGQNHYAYFRQKEMDDLYKKGIELIGNNIIFTGPKENVNEYLQLSDIFVLNSSHEGLPNALLEAMACGIPPIVRHIKGIEGMILKDNFNSLIVNENESFAEKIAFLLENSVERARIGTNAANFIKQNHTFDRTSELLFGKLNSPS